MLSLANAYSCFFGLSKSHDFSSCHTTNTFYGLHKQRGYSYGKLCCKYTQLATEDLYMQ
jgi:hypothetical protein